jgi:hypothetical protein
MTPAEWNTCTDPQKMLEFLHGKASNRKLRLFAVACSRRLLPLTSDHRVGDALNVAEQFADGLASDEERSNVRKAVQQAAQVRGVVVRPDTPRWQRRIASLAYYATAGEAMDGASTAPQLALEAFIWRAGGYKKCDSKAIKQDEWKIQCDILRDIFGNPIRPLPAIAPSLMEVHGTTLLQLALAGYEERESSSGHLDRARLAVLSDALEEAGAEPDLVGHLREPGPHYRGCWVVDLLTGRE